MRADPERSALAACAAGALALACAVGPDYEPPLAPELPQWSAPLQGGLAGAAPEPARLAGWWTALGDPLLVDLIERATTLNLDVASASERVRAAAALRRIARSDLFPIVTAGGDFDRGRSSEEVGTGETRSLYRAGFDAVWELDLFGGVRRGVEAAQADLEAARYDLRDVQVSIASEVALAYVDARAFQERIAIAERNLAAQSETYDITRWRAEAGLVTDLDVERARTNLEQTRASIPSLATALELARHRLAVLIGEPPGALTALLSGPEPIPATPDYVAVGVPADALRQRPDVRRAERVLAAETARVGVATAAAYPSFSLFGSIGLESLEAERLLHSGAWAASIAASAVQTVLDAGAIAGGIEAQDAARAAALADYQSAVLVALEDVENALVAYAQEQERRQALADAAAAADRAAALASFQYGAGLVDFQVVLDAQRSLFVLQDQLAESRGEVTANLIRLYKALGGGWTPEPVG
jgi:NodT family efflux transporter outer membrane factor (OMF) lipoprotein